MTRVAVVDLGTNSTRLLVADVDGERLVEVDRRLTITRLGEGVDASRRLHPDAIARVEACLAGYGRAAAELDAERGLAFATSAVRDAADGRELLTSIEPRFGFGTRLLSGDEEALLTFRGVASGRLLPDPTLVVDLGGGSTELTLGRSMPNRLAVDVHASLDIGCVRLTERFLKHDPPAAAEVASLRSFVRSLLDERLGPARRPQLGIGVAGTVTTLATLHLGLAEEDPALVHGHWLPREWIEAETGRLAQTPVAALRRRTGILPGRAPVIAAGALGILAVVEHFDLEGLDVSEFDILHGVALDLASP